MQLCKLLTVLLYCFLQAVPDSTRSRSEESDLTFTISLTWHLGHVLLDSFSGFKAGSFDVT
jgi:hypothetical protein